MHNFTGLQAIIRTLNQELSLKNLPQYDIELFFKAKPNADALDLLHDYRVFFRTLLDSKQLSIL